MNITCSIIFREGDFYAYILKLIFAFVCLFFSLS